MRLDRMLVAGGFGTRKEVRALIQEGMVTVDGERIVDPGFKVDPFKAEVRVGEEKVMPPGRIYLMLNKPAGVVTSTADPRYPTVIQLLPPEYARRGVFPVGRLDLDTEGLLIITTDGKLAHRLTSPHRHVPKRYFVRVRGYLTGEDVEAMQEGIVLEDGYKCLPAHLNILYAGEISEAELTIYEGKYHQVKRMFARRRKKVLYLKRVAMGPLELDPSLPPGGWRELTPDEVAALKKV